MTRLRTFLVCVVAVSAMLVPAASPANAHHANTCGETHDVPIATGNVTMTQQNDWWTYNSTVPVTTVTLTMSGGDADLYVYRPCGTLICSSIAGGSTTDVCPRMIGTGRMWIRVSWFSGTTVTYTLSVTHP